MTASDSTSPPPAILALVSPGQGDRVRAAATALAVACETARSLAQLLERIRERAWTATVISLDAESVDEAMAARIAQTPEAGALVLCTTSVSLHRALAAERAGAVALVRDPLDPDQLAETLRAVVDEGPVVSLPGSPASREDGPVMIGTGPAMERAFQTLARVAPTPSTVLVTGESGTGKEVAARVIHWASPRRDGPFVPVNCAAIPEHLLESELFGHERGAFTGAVARRVGRFERAHGGTLFLDEIGDMSLVLQAKILRVLEERRLERVGGENPVEVDVRIVAATNQPLRERIRDGEFREDLYYRLAVVEVELPPLRNRGPDIRVLALHYAGEFSRRHSRPLKGVTEEALRRLEAHAWPGNVRELRNVMERAVLLTSGDVLRSAGLRLGAGAPRASALTPDAASGYPPSMTLQEVEAAHIRRILDVHGGHMGRAADALGIHRNTLTRKVREYGIGEAYPTGDGS